MEDVLKPPGSLLATYRSKGEPYVLRVLAKGFGVNLAKWFWSRCFVS